MKGDHSLESIFLGVLLGLTVWYLILFSFSYEEGKCHDNLDKQSSKMGGSMLGAYTCREGAVYITWLVVLAASCMGAIGFLGMDDMNLLPSVLGGKKRRRR